MCLIKPYLLFTLTHQCKIWAERTVESLASSCSTRTAYVRKLNIKSSLSRRWSEGTLVIQHPPARVYFETPSATVSILKRQKASTSLYDQITIFRTVFYTMWKWATFGKTGLKPFSIYPCLHSSNGYTTFFPRTWSEEQFSYKDWTTFFFLSPWQNNCQGRCRNWAYWVFESAFPKVGN